MLGLIGIGAPQANTIRITALCTRDERGSGADGRKYLHMDAVDVEEIYAGRDTNNAGTEMVDDLRNLTLAGGALAT